MKYFPIVCISVLVITLILALSIPRPKHSSQQVNSSQIATTNRFDIESTEYLTSARSVDYIGVIKDKNTDREYMYIIRSGNIAVIPLLEKKQ